MAEKLKYRDWMFVDAVVQLLWDDEIDKAIADYGDENDD